MCLYPRLITNRKYTSTKKNKGIIPQLKDERVKYVAVGCGNCIECRKQKARSWQIRLQEEIKEQKYKYFITLTFSNEALLKISEQMKVPSTECNAIAGQAVRYFLERWRKKYKKSVKHWLITELGHEGTERIHLHGILMPEFEINKEILSSIWQYGRVDIGAYCNEKSINYIVKYVTKIDIQHKNYRADIFCSAGLGKKYVSTHKEYNKYNDTDTREFYHSSKGQKIALPIYYRNKLYSEEEREKLWINRIEKNEIYVCGIKCDISTDAGIKNYLTLLKSKQKENKAMGYGTNENEWKEKKYNISLRSLRNAKNEKK